MAGTDAEKGADGGVPGAAAVEAEDKLIEIGLKVLARPPGSGASDSPLHQPETH